jgi:hypothetical protein
MKFKKQKRWFVFRTAAVVILVLMLGAASATAQGGPGNRDDTDPLPPSNRDRDKGEPVLPPGADPAQGDFELVPNTIDRTLVVPACAFTSDGNDVEDYFKSFSGGYVKGRGALGACLCAPLIFPDNARRLRRVKVYVHDDSASWDSFFDLYRVDITTGTASHMGGFTTSDSTGVVRYTINPSSRAIGNRYAWQLCTCLYPDSYLYGAGADYEY